MNVLVGEVIHPRPTVVTVGSLRVVSLVRRGGNLPRPRPTMVYLRVRPVDLRQHLLLPIISVVLAALSLVRTFQLLHLGTRDLMAQGAASSHAADTARVLILNPPTHEGLILALTVLNDCRRRDRLLIVPWRLRVDLPKLNLIEA